MVSLLRITSVCVLLASIWIAGIKPSEAVDGCCFEVVLSGTTTNYPCVVMLNGLPCYGSARCTEDQASMVNCNSNPPGCSTGQTWVQCGFIHAILLQRGACDFWCGSTQASGPQSSPDCDPLCCPGQNTSFGFYAACGAPCCS